MTDETLYFPGIFSGKTRAIVIRLKARVARRPGRWRRTMKGRHTLKDGEDTVQVPDRLRAA